MSDIELDDDDIDHIALAGGFKHNPYKHIKKFIYSLTNDSSSDEVQYVPSVDLSTIGTEQKEVTFNNCEISELQSTDNVSAKMQLDYSISHNSANAKYSHFRVNVMFNELSIKGQMFSSYDLINAGYVGHIVSADTRFSDDLFTDNKAANKSYIIYSKKKLNIHSKLSLIETRNICYADILESDLFPINILCINSEHSIRMFNEILLLIVETILRASQDSTINI